MEARKIVWQAKVCAAKSSDLNLIPRAHMMEGKNKLPKTVL